MTLAEAREAPGLSPENQELAAALDLLQFERGPQWAQPNDAESHRLHGLFQYPAMMVPQMQHDILDLLRQEFDAPRVWDPFVGSGTTLAEAMNLGLDFTGRDINPLAILICRVKAGPYHVDAFSDSASRVLTAVATERGRALEVVFPNWRKWFRYDVAVALSRIRRAIRAETNPACRRFHWLALAETVRLSSNSRVSTVKLHIRPEEQLRRAIDVTGLYESILLRNLARVTEQRDSLVAEGYLKYGHYTGEIVLELGDTRDLETVPGDHSCQITLTSPPYGDNASTVTYGQQAFLPLQWIDLADIHPDAHPAVVSSTHALDTMSLGGSKRLAEGAISDVTTASPALAATFKRLRKEPADRAKRVAAFFRDLDQALPPILHRLSEGSIMAWTVGNRRVGGKPVPLDAALIELLAAREVRLVGRLEREIPQGFKRMPNKNGHVDTIGSETVLVFRT
ncbi:MAG TPA: hypothetical protein VF587_16070 [Solirubrobacteraceae bacterium]|jgi:site-specific DNA-methyltransferase (cytosine-N4-specific)